MAHDLRNPFSAVVLLSDLIREDIENNNTQEAMNKAQVMNDTSKMTYSLLLNLLEWARIQQGVMPFNPEEHLVQALVREELSFLQLTMIHKAIDVVVKVTDGLTVVADSNMVRIVLRNLLTNAIKYSPIESKIQVGAFQFENNVLFEIRDFGIGMTQEEMDKVFRIDSNLSKPGTGGEPGTGLGLVLCHEFISLHGGKIWVESRPNFGSTFRFSIPVK